MKTPKPYAENIADIVNRANTEVVISSKKLPSEYYENSEVVKAMEEALQRGVHIYILTGPEPESKPPYLDRTKAYITPHGPVVNFVVGVSERQSWLGRLLAGPKNDLLFSPFEEGIGETYVRKDDPVSGSELTGKFFASIVDLTPYTPNLEPSSN